MSTHSPETTTTREDRAAPAGRFDRGTPAATTGGSSGRATAALVLGVLSIPLALLSPIVGLVLAVVGLVLGMTAKGDIRRRGLTNMSNAKWGVILSGVGIVIAIANAVVGAIILS
jgi:hypothetical protein